MSGGPTVTAKVHFGTGRRSRKKLKTVSKPTRPAARVPRVAKLMALAIRFDQLIRDSVVNDQAELARLGHVSRARETQIIYLLNLEPHIQEELLYLPPVEKVKDAVTERELRAIVTEVGWGRQRGMWEELKWRQVLSF